MRKKRDVERDIYIELVVVFCILVSLGFPGQYSRIYGEAFGKICEYAAFIAQIVLIFTSHAERWDDIELLNLKRKYIPIYVYVGTVTLISMLVTSERSDETITCVRWFVTLLFAIWLQEYFTMENLLRIIAIAQGAFVLLTLFLIVRYPSMRYDPVNPEAVIGIVSTKNGCAIEYVFGILVTIFVIRFEHQRHRPIMRWAALVMIQFVLLLLANATGAMFTLIIALVPALMHRSYKLPLGILYITVNVVFLFAMLTFMPLFEDFFEAIGKDATLTGRIPLWRQIIEVMSSHKTMTGYGYGMFWRDPIAVNMIQTGFNSRHNRFMANISSGAHNVLLEMWLNIGLLGIASYFFALIRSFFRVEEMENDAYIIASVLMTFLMVNGLTERCLGSNYDYKTLALFLAMAMGCNRRIKSVYALRGNGSPVIETDSGIIPQTAT